MNTKSLVASLLIISLIFAGCAGATNAERQTKHGVIGGAVAGAAIGRALNQDGPDSMIIGAALGALAGGIVGNKVGAYMDKQEQELRNAMAASDAAMIQRTNDVLVATFKSDIMFDLNSAVLKPGATGEISRVSAVLTKYPDTTIRVEGHTDSTGSEAYNQQLSDRRALAVKNALIQQSVGPERIQAIGYGESMPISTLDQQNRRVSIVITPRARG